MAVGAEAFREAAPAAQRETAEKTPARLPMSRPANEERPAPGKAEARAAKTAEAQMQVPAEEPTAQTAAPIADAKLDLKEKASLKAVRGPMPPSLRGSAAVLERQNERLEAEGLERIEDEDDLAARIAHRLLIPVPASDALVVNANLPEQHRYCRPWTARFLADLARAHYTAFHRPIEVSSAVRTVDYQQRLIRTNGNAAPAEGEIVSPHLMGATIDIAKGTMNAKEIAWMRRRLTALVAAQKIDVEEEFQQACFHITVYKSYAPRPAQTRGNSTRSHSRPQAETDSVEQAAGM